MIFVCVMRRRPPVSTRTGTLVPYTALVVRGGAAIPAGPAPQPAPAFQRGIADAAKAEAAEQRAPRLCVQAERGGEGRVDGETRRRCGVGRLAVRQIGRASCRERVCQYV